MNNKQAENGAISFGTLLFLIFLILKLTKNIDWSWWWVFGPLWIPVAIALVLIILFMLIK